MEAWPLRRIQGGTDPSNRVRVLSDTPRASWVTVTVTEPLDSRSFLTTSQLRHVHRDAAQALQGDSYVHPRRRPDRCVHRDRADTSPVRGADRVVAGRGHDTRSE